MAINDLEDRLIDFAVLCIDITKEVVSSYASTQLSTQLIRSSSSAALNYGEVQSAESPKDFVHKLKVVLKELRENFVNLKIIKKAKLCLADNLIKEALQENDELVRIYVASITTSRKKSIRLKST